MESNDNPLDNNIYTIVLLSGTLFILTTSILLITYLALNNKILPYKYQSSFWIVIVVILVIIDQLYTLIVNLAIINKKAEDDEQRITIANTTFIVNNFFIDPLIFISFITREYSIAMSIQYNTDFIKKYLNNIKEDKDQSSSVSTTEENIKSSFFKKRFRYFQVFIASFGIVSVFFVVVYYTEYLLDCILAMYDLFYKKSKFNSSNNDTLTKVTIGLNIYFILWYALFVFYVTLLFKIFKYNIQKDRLKMKFEFCALLFINYTHFNIKHVFQLLQYKELNAYFISYDCGFNALIVILYVFLTVWRYCLFKQFSIEKIIDNFAKGRIRDTNNIFIFLKTMIIKFNSEAIKYLSFYNDYNNYQRWFKGKNNYLLIPGNSIIDANNNIIIDNNAGAIKDHVDIISSKAKEIFTKYYTINASNLTEARVDYLIKFPDSINEKARNIITKTAYEYHSYSYCFDEGLNWVKEQMITITNEFKLKRENMNQLERIIFFIDCYEI